MKLTYSFNINNDCSLSNLCGTSKDLYNQSLKVVNDSYANKIINSGLLFNPIKIRNLYTDLNFL